DEDEELRRALKATEVSSKLHMGNDAGTSVRDTNNEDQTVGTGSDEVSYERFTRFLTAAVLAKKEAYGGT
ncbi:hypothetical protein E4U51_000978, partial [Claviceps purpurea]